MKYTDDDDTGCILEVVFEYPQEVHDLHKDYPMAAEITTINADMLSSVQDIFTNSTTARRQEMRRQESKSYTLWTRKSMCCTYQSYSFT